MASRGFPYLAVANLKYKSPHKQDLTFSKGEKIRVVSLAPKTEDPDDDDDDDDEWFIGESLDGSRKGTFPGGFVTISEDQEEEQVATSKDAAVAAPITSEVIKDTDEKQELEEEKEEGFKNKIDGATAPPTTTTDSQQVLSTTEEKTGFGAPLPARPQSDDEDEEVAEEKIVEEKKEAVVAPQTSEVEKEKPAQSQATPITTSTPSAPPSRSTTLSPPPRQNSTSSSPTTTTTSKPIAPSKPNSLKDRIAAFNKPAESGGGAPPPLPKSKPGGWKRPAPAPGAPKPLLPGAKPTVTSPPPISSTTSTGQPPITTESSKVSTEETSSKEKDGVTSSGSGFSAADAKSSIKMSLKERMAALQRGDSPADDSSEAKSHPVPAPGKISQEKRNVALGGMGLATGEAGLSRKLSNASKEEGDEAITTDEPTGKDLEASETAGATVSSSSPSVQKESSALVEEDGSEHVGEPSASQEEIQDQPELTEEEQESARRAAIAERLAKLGGRRMGGGPSMFGGPPPPVKPTKASMDAVTSTESSTSIDSPAAATNAGAGEGEGGIEEAVSKPQTLAVPRRAAPPRRKKSSATPPPVPSTQASESVTSQGEADSEEPSEQVESGLESTPAIADNLVEEESPKEIVEETEPAGQEVEDVEEANVAPALSTAREAEPEGDLEEEVNPLAPSLDEAPEAVSSLDQEDEAQEDEEPEEVEAPAAIPPRPTSIPPRPPSTGSIQTPSRPGSVRPPIPKSSLPPPPAETKAEEEEGEEETSASNEIPRPTSIASPPPRRQLPTPTPPAGRPPIPKSPPPLSPGVGEENEEGDGNAGHGRQPSLGAVLAAPKPRHAVPTDDFEDDAEDASQVQPSSSATQELDPTVEEPAAGQTESQASEQQQPEETEPELTEEEQEAERKAAITRRIAALSRGQMMPGMPGMNAFGAPMPIRKKTAPPVQAEESQDQVEAEETSNRISSPPLPRSPPPSIPTDNRRGSIQSISSIASPPPLPPGRRSTQISEDNRTVVESGEDSLSRGASFRPPIPKSREPSTASALGNAQEEEEEEETGVAQVESSERDVVEDDDQAYATAIANQFTPSEEIQPPTLPTSPPPRAPPSAPSQALPGRPSIDRSLPPTPQVTQQSSNVNPEPAESHLSTPSATQMQAPTATTGSNFSQKSNSSRDLDLMPSSQWWRKGLTPLRLPPTIAGRPDCILYVDQASQTKRGRTKHTAEIHVLFEDYSQSVVELSFEDDDAEENATVLNQRHYFPPSKPTGEQLSKWSSTIGSAIAKAASSSTGKHATVVGDGSSRSFIATLLSQVKSALPPINQTYGSVILVQVGATVMEKSSDEIKAGDIVACFNSDFRGKKGLTPYHLVLGSQLEPALAIVVEIEAKKNKLKCVLQNANKGPEEVSLRLDDLKSGVLKVFRAVPNQGYLEDW